MSVVASAEETAELLPNQTHDDNDDESYFIDYAIQKEIINRNRCTASRRLLSHVANYPELSVTNSNQQNFHQKVGKRVFAKSFIYLSLNKFFV